MKCNVLVYPSGAENAIEIYYSIRESIHINVIPASAKDDHSQLIYSNPVEYLPYIQSEDFIEKLNELIEREKINFIFPTHDTVALFLSEKKDLIKCEVITSDYYTNYVCRYKKQTYEVFKDLRFCPKVYYELLNEEEYPIIVKPNVGEGAKGVKLLNSRAEHAALFGNNDLIFVENMPGKEYTIDCFTNRQGELQFTGPRQRVEIKMGISFRSTEIKAKERFVEIAEQINKKLKFHGLWFFQLKEDENGELKLLEISTRAAGTMGFYRHKGVNLPLLSIFDALGYKVSIQENNYDIELFRSTKNRYKYSFNFKKVYLDFDDTLVQDGKVNLDVISFIYHCKNSGKQIYLITQHAFDIDQTLEKYSISKGLFEKIVLLKPNENKSDFIDPDQAIFIDNWYKIRKEVFDKHNIPVFDVDVVNSLFHN